MSYERHRHMMVCVFSSSFILGPVCLYTILKFSFISLFCGICLTSSIYDAHNSRGRPYVNNILCIHVLTYIYIYIYIYTTVGIHTYIH
jgi:hypothetical protein